MESDAPATKKARVLVRVRPAVEREYQLDQAAEALPGNTSIRLYSTQQTYESTFDHVFNPSMSQAAVYSHVADYVQSTLMGFNNTIFAYGQTGTGKTHTMTGPPELFASTAAAAAVPTATTMHGVVPRAAHDLFCQLQAKRAEQPGLRARVECSYLELYNERLYDLLQPYKKAHCRDPRNINQRKAALEVKEDPTRGMCVPELLYAPVDDWQAVMQLVATGNRNRAVRLTEQNQNSSRSHVLLQLWLELELPGQEGTVIRSKLSLVDLAGSERWGARHTSSGDTAMISEMTAINSSLSALAMVVTAVTEKARHVPYRSSKLTHLLKDAFGGNCNTAIIATLSPCCDAFDESLASLRFADRVANVANKAVVNRSSQSAAVALANRDREIARLRALLASLAPGPPVTPGPPATPGPPGTAGPGAGITEGLASSSNGRAGTQGGADVWQEAAEAATDAAATAAAAAAVASAKLAEELEDARRALEFERALRTRLQAQLLLREQEREQQLREQQRQAEQQEQIQQLEQEIDQQQQRQQQQKHASTSGSSGAAVAWSPTALPQSLLLPSTSSTDCSADVPALLRSYSPEALPSATPRLAATASCTPRTPQSDLLCQSNAPWSPQRPLQQPTVTWGRSSLQMPPASPRLHSPAAAAAAASSPGWSSDCGSPTKRPTAQRKWLPEKPWEAISSGPVPFSKSTPVRRRTADVQQRASISPPRTGRGAATSPARAASRSRGSIMSSPLPYAVRATSSGGHDDNRPGRSRSSSQQKQRRSSSGHKAHLMPGSSSGGYGSSSSYGGTPAPLRNALSGIALGSGALAALSGIKPGTLMFLMGGAGNSVEAKRLSHALAKSQSAR